ncbi:hypothetical protein ES703_77254 [subsurface metagenome]
MTIGLLIGNQPLQSLGNISIKIPAIVAQRNGNAISSCPVSSLKQGLQCIAGKERGRAIAIIPAPSLVIMLEVNNIKGATNYILPQCII